MKILLCSVPDGSIKKNPEPLIPRSTMKKGMYSWSGKDNEQPTFPIGLMRIYAAMERSNYKGDIYDINNLRHSDEELIKNFKKIKPSRWRECSFTAAVDHGMYWCVLCWCADYFPDERKNRAGLV